jgi:hypothetical protein
VLYWFRTPPNVKVGRPALDQEAIRWIEEHNPDIEFDWPKILESSAPSPSPVDDASGRRPRRGRPERRQWPDRRATQRVGTNSPPRRAPWPADSAQEPPPADETRELPVDTVDSDVEADLVEPDLIDEEDVAEEAARQIVHPDAEPAAPVALPAVETVLGREQLIRFRARYAELLARIIERGGEPARVDELRAQAEPLDPDSWVTLEEARRGVVAFEPKIRELRAALGLKRRRRSRRGGRRRRESLTAGQTSSSDATSKAADATSKFEDASAPSESAADEESGEDPEA